VARTESILTAYDNFEWLRDHASELPEVKWAGPAPVQPADLPQIAAKARALADHFARAAKASTSPAAFADAARALTTFAARLDGATGDKAAAVAVAARLTEWERAFVRQLRDMLAMFRPGPPDLTRLPPELKGHYVGLDGSYALYIYPRENLWDQAHLAAFATDVEARVAPVPGDRTVTGIAISMFHTTSIIQASFYKATFYALGLIFILVLIDLRRIGQTLFAISVLAVGLPMLVALMGLFGVDWNFANFFGLPILIGAGHEYGVFLVHRYREAVRDPRRVWRRWDVSDRALLLCAYVTTSSFGFFWALAHHRGLRSLGFVMALGTVCIYLAAVLVLRPLLLWRLATRGRRATARRT
jgi:hypothetical protein